MQKEIDERNMLFWEELCGSQLAKTLRLNVAEESSLEKFDQAYLSMYPYLLECIPVSSFQGKKVLEVGLGYGTLGQQLSLHVDEYRGLDIARGPVDMMNTRIIKLGKSQKNYYAVQGSMLECPFEDDEFDIVVSVGCFHHTGNLQKCVDETFRILKPGGKAFIMVYNKFSYRNWIRWPLNTINSVVQGNITGRTEEERIAYDANLQGDAAPETVFTSIGELEKMFENFKLFRACKRNCGIPYIQSLVALRNCILPIVGPIAGLDIYVSASK